MKLSFRQKIFFSYLVVFLLFFACMFPLVSQWVNHIVFQAIEDRVTEVIRKIEDAPNNESLIRRLKDQKSSLFFRVSVINNDKEVLYDSHVKRVLGPKFSQDFVIDHPEVNGAFTKGKGYYEGESKLMKKKFAYFAKAFDFHGKTYVLRAAFPHQYVLEITGDLELAFLGFSSAMLLMFCILTWIVLHYLTRPIRQIVTAIKPYQEGEQNILPAIDVRTMAPGGEFTSLALTLNSLSEKIQHHIDNLVHERNEKAAILESLVEGVIAVNDQLVVTYANHMAAKFLNYTDAPLEGQRLHLDQHQEFAGMLEQCHRENQILTREFIIQSEGKKLYLEAIAAPKEGDRGAILVLLDNTAHHRIYEMRRDFIANASHELKTPITVIKGYAEALHDNPNLSREVQEQITEKISRSCSRMTSLIKDLLTLADIENIPPSRLSVCNIYDLAISCRTMVQEAFPDAKLEVDKMNEDVTLVVDRELLEMALLNLMENGAKYSNRPAHITVSISGDAAGVKISVQDRGIGIPLSDQEHIFERFYTVDKAHSQRMGGSGLGLSIVKTIVEKHFGRIELASEPGKGSTFTILLPKMAYENLEE